MSQAVGSSPVHAYIPAYSSNFPPSGSTRQSLISDLDFHQLAEVVRRTIHRPDVGHLAADFIQVTKMSGRQFMNLKKQRLLTLAKNDPIVTEVLLRLQTAPQQFFATMLSSIITEHTERNRETSYSQSSIGKKKPFTPASAKDRSQINGTATLDKHPPIPGIGNESPEASAEANTSLHASSDDLQLAQDVDVYIPQNDDTLVEEEKCNPTVIGTKSLVDIASLHIYPPPLQSTCTNDYDGIYPTSGGAASALMAEPGGNADAPQNSKVTGADDAEKNPFVDHDLHPEEVKGGVLGVDRAIAHTNISEGTSVFDTDVSATSFLKESSGAIDDFSNSTKVAHSPFVTDHCYPVVPDMVDEVPQTDEAPFVDAVTMGEPTVPVTLGKVSQDADPSELVDPMSSVPDETPAIMPPSGLERSPHDSTATSEEVVMPDAENEMGSDYLSNPINAEQSPSVDPESSLPAPSVDCWDELPNSDDHFSKFCFVLPIMPVSAHNWTVGANTVLSFVEHPDEFDSADLVSSTPRNHPLPSNTLEAEELVHDDQSHLEPAAEKDFSHLMPGDFSTDDVDEWQSLLQVAPSGVAGHTLTSVQTVQNEAAVSTSVGENEGLLINFSEKSEENISSVDIAQPSYNDLSEITMDASGYLSDDAIAAVPGMLDDDDSDDDDENDEPRTVEGTTSTSSQLPRLDVDFENRSLWDEISPCLSEDNPFRYPTPTSATLSSVASSSRTLWPMNEGFSDSTLSWGAFEDKNGVSRFAKAGDTKRLVSSFHTDASIQTDLNCQRELRQIQQADLCRMASSPLPSPREPRSLQDVLPGFGIISRLWKIGVSDYSTAESSSPLKVEVREDGVYPKSQGPLSALSP